MLLHPGSRVGAYEVLGSLGAGGMGEVYRAKDSTLKREVALKVLPAAVAADADRLARFQREAEVLASLNHPHIAGIYGIEISGVKALVMELVEGPTLADRIAQGALAVDEAIPIAAQIAEALEAAHEQGIVHRDLKPANIKVRPDGTVKVLDFGLAKAMDAVPGGRDFSPADSPTITSPAMTAMGVILGTASYMAPEQAKGKPVDKRADIWAFGCVLFEMLAARPPFTGETVTDVIAAAVTKEPDWQALPSTLPKWIRHLMARCLQKDPKKRLRDIGDARLELIGDSRDVESAASPSAAAARPGAVVLLGAGFVIVSMALAAVLIMQPTPVPPARLTRLTIPTPIALPLTASVQASARVFAAAPDGSFLAYRTGIQGRLAVRYFDRLDVLVVPGITDVLDLVVSPDSRWIGYVAADRLMKVAVSGGSPVTLARLPSLPRGLSWIDDDTIVVGTNSPTTGLLRVPAGVGEPTVLTTLLSEQGETGHLLPSALPGGRALLFTIGAPQGADAQIALLDLQTGQRTTLLKGGSDARYVASGHLVYSTSGGLSAVRFDLTRRELSGSPVRMVDRLGAVATGALNAAVTSGGTLVYLPEGIGEAAGSLLVWVDRQGRETPIPAPPRAYRSVRLSPDGTSVAVTIGDQEQDIWVWDLARQTLTRLTFDPSGDIMPVWTADGRSIVFASTRTGIYNLYERAADGTGSDVRLTTSSDTQAPDTVTPDGAFVIGREVQSKSQRADLVRIALGSRGEARAADVLLKTPFDEYNADVSPDGHFIAYQSGESGRNEVYVSPFPQMANGRWQVSTSGGSQPAWTRGGRELAFLDGAGHLAVVAVEASGGSFRTGRLGVLTTAGYGGARGSEAAWRTYDVPPDGRRFLMIKEAVVGTESPFGQGFIVVQNWLEELKRLVPAK